MNGRVRLSNRSEVDSVLAIRTTLVLGLLFKRRPDTLLNLARKCRDASQPLDTAELQRLQIAKDGDNIDEIRSIVVCTVKGDKRKTLGLIDPTVEPPKMRT